MATRKRNRSKTNKKVKSQGRAIAQVERSLSKRGQLRENRVKIPRALPGKYDYEIANYATQPVSRQLSDMGNTNMQALKVLQRKMETDYNAQFFDYMATLAHPFTVTNVIIPDWTTFPRGVSQIRTVATVRTGNNAADNTFVISLIPALQKSGYFTAPAGVSPSFITVDGVKFGPGQPAGAIFNVHGFNDWATILDSYRVISMGVKVTYIGQVLNTAGKITCGCLPPMASPPTTYEVLSEYNYAYTGAAAGGCAQVLLAAGLEAFNLIDIGDTFGFTDFSFIQIACSGLPLNTDVLQIEWVMNIETYADTQILTANAYAGKPDMQKLGASGAAMAAAHKKGKLNGPSTHTPAILKSVLTEGAHIAAPLVKEFVGGDGGELAAKLLSAALKFFV